MEQVDIFQNAISFLKNVSFPKGRDHFFHIEKQMFVQSKSGSLHPLSINTDKNPPFVLWPFEVLNMK